MRLPSLTSQSSSRSARSIRPSRRGMQRILSQLALGCGLALVCAFVLRMFGVEIAAVDILIACVLGISLVLLSRMPWNFRRVRRVH